jgi:hypothetical protein
VIHIALSLKVHPRGGARVSTLAQKNRPVVVKVESPDERRIKNAKRCSAVVNPGTTRRSKQAGAASIEQFREVGE